MTDPYQKPNRWEFEDDGSGDGPPWIFLLLWLAPIFVIFAFLIIVGILLFRLVTQ